MEDGRVERKCRLWSVVNNVWDGEKEEEFEAKIRALEGFLPQSVCPPYESLPSIARHKIADFFYWSSYNALVEFQKSVLDARIKRHYAPYLEDRISWREFEPDLNAALEEIQNSYNTSVSNGALYLARIAVLIYAEKPTRRVIDHWNDLPMHLRRHIYSYIDPPLLRAHFDRIRGSRPWISICEIRLRNAKAELRVEKSYLKRNHYWDKMNKVPGISFYGADSDWDDYKRDRIWESSRKWWNYREKVEREDAPLKEIRRSERKEYQRVLFCGHK